MLTNRLAISVVLVCHYTVGCVRTPWTPRILGGPASIEAFKNRQHKMGSFLGHMGEVRPWAACQGQPTLLPALCRLLGATYIVPSPWAAC